MAHISDLQIRARVSAPATYSLYEDAMTVPFGTLRRANGGWLYKSEGGVDEREGYVQYLLEPNMSLFSAVAAVRQASVAMYDDWRQESEAEFAAENAWLRYAEMPTMDDLGFERWEEERGVFH